MVHEHNQMSWSIIGALLCYNSDGQSLNILNIELYCVPNSYMEIIFYDSHFCS